EGERVPMHPGDFVLTPYWCWHDHGHAGTEPVIWLDALDNPFAQFFGTMFRENYPHDSQALTQPSGETEARYGSGLMPVEYRSSTLSSPLLAYPYDRTRETLDRLARGGPLHPAHRIKMRYANPTTGGPAFPPPSGVIPWPPQSLSRPTYPPTPGADLCAVPSSGPARAGAR